MSTIQANVRINIPDDTQIQPFIEALRAQMTQINGRPTKINVVEVDDPVTTSRISAK